MTKKQKQALRFSKIVIISVIIIIIVFTGCILYTFNKKGAEPTVIITAFFAFMTGEVLALAKIKLSEITAEGSIKKEKEQGEIKDGNSV